MGYFFMKKKNNVNNAKAKNCTDVSLRGADKRGMIMPFHLAIKMLEYSPKG